MEFADSTIIAADNTTFKVNSFVIKLNSELLWTKLEEAENRTLHMDPKFSSNTIEYTLKYMYSFDLMKIPYKDLYEIAERYEIIGLKVSEI
jgi:hypothetical protein